MSQYAKSRPDSAFEGSYTPSMDFVRIQKNTHFLYAATLLVVITIFTAIAL